MVKKKVDERVVGLIEWNIQSNHRSLFILVGDHGKDQVENLHKILSKSRVKSRPTVLWCYKKELGFSTHRKKRIKEIKRSQSRGLYDPDRDDPFDLFISTTNIRWTYYKDTEKILGQTFGMCVLQDFDGITPNLLARTIETVEGGGLVILLLKTVKSLKQLYTMTMDVHSRYRTEAHHEITPRFSERFILSLSECKSCLVLDDELNILPISSNIQHIPAAGTIEMTRTDPTNQELEALKASLQEDGSGTSHIAALVSLAKTIDQAKAVMSFLDAITEKTLRSTVSLTAARGRGKSAAIGICLAGAVAYGYSNIFVTAPSPENLKSVFEFLIAGLNAVKFKEHIDYEVLQEHRGEEGGGNVVTRVNIFREHRQTVQYILPTDYAVLAQAELVAIDEAAAIPLPIVQKLLGPYLVFLSSTVNGYEGTGRALSLKLIQQLRQQQGQSMARNALTAGNAVAGSKEKKGQRKVHEERWKVAAETAASGSGLTGRTLTELTLDTPIRYGKGDHVESWLNQLLCLDSSNAATRLVNVMPAPKDCELYLVDRDALFSYHTMAEGLLQRIWSLYTSAHYKNTPNDLQMLSDAPAHRLFVLLGPRRESTRSNGGVVLPDILCVIQIAFEGRISAASVQAQLSRNNKASGDMIPWTVSQQFNDNDFATLSGARVVRVATHPDVQGMGYGSRALDLLVEYFQGNLGGGRLNYGEFQPEGVVDDDEENESEEEEYDESISQLRQEKITQKKKLPPLLIPLADRPAERLDWIGVSYGLTSQLYNFWSKRDFKLCYLRQTVNDLTGEHSAIMLRELDSGEENHAIASNWLSEYVEDYRRRIISLLSLSLRELPSSSALSLIVNSNDSLQFKGNNASSASAQDSNDREDDIDGTSPLPAASSSSSSNPLTATELTSIHFSHHDLKRLELYSRNMVDHHMILDMVPLLAKLYYLNRFPSNITLSALQNVILLSIGLQLKSVDDIAKELNLPVNQILAFFNKTIRKLSTTLREILEADISSQMISKKKQKQLEMKATQMLESSLTSLASDQQEDEEKFQHKLKLEKEKLLKSPTPSSEATKNDLLIESFERGMKKQNQIPKTISIPKEVSRGNSEEGRAGEGDEKIEKKRKSEEKKKKNKMKKSRHEE